jgi:hypothetical protein
MGCSTSYVQHIQNTVLLRSTIFNHTCATASSGLDASQCFQNWPRCLRRLVHEFHAAAKRDLEIDETREKPHVRRATGKFPDGQAGMDRQHVDVQFVSPWSWAESIKTLLLVQLEYILRNTMEIIPQLLTRTGASSGRIIVDDHFNSRNLP